MTVQRCICRVGLVFHSNEIDLPALETIQLGTDALRFKKDADNLLVLQGTAIFPT